jgi:exodeoxyribonuclease VII small subunit
MTKEQTTAQLQTELSGLLEWFEAESVDLDEAVEKYKRGVAIVAELQKRLKQTENTINKISKL